MPLCDFEDIEIYYETAGDGEPLVFISGYSCDHSYWNEYVKRFSPAFKVVVFDNRGVGRTKDSELPFTVDMMAFDLSRLLDHLNIRRAHIVGQSMGGSIAMMFAKNYPERVKGLAIFNSVAKFRALSQMALLNLLRLKELKVPLEDLVGATIPWVFSNDFVSSRSNVEQFVELMIKNPYPQKVKNQRRQFVALCQFDARQWLHQIDMQTMILASEDDLLAPIKEVRVLADAIVNSVLSIIAGGHASPLEVPEVVAEKLMSFLQNTHFR